MTGRLVLAALALLWGGATQAAGADPSTLARGAHLYSVHCASCHGANLEGEPNWRLRKPNGRLPAPPHDYSGHTWHHPDQVLFALTKDGVEAHAPAGYQSDMPGFGDRLRDQEIRAVIAYIRNTWPLAIQAQQQRLTEGYQGP